MGLIKSVFLSQKHCPNTLTCALAREPFFAPPFFASTYTSMRTHAMHRNHVEMRAALTGGNTARTALTGGNTRAHRAHRCFLPLSRQHAFTAFTTLTTVTGMSQVWWCGGAAVRGLCACAWPMRMRMRVPYAHVRLP